MTQMTQMTQELGNTKTSSIRGRKWCLTLNNWSIEDLQNLKNTLTQKHAMFCIGEEIGEQGTPHLQGYVEFKNPLSLQSLKKINTKIHWERTRGSKEQNIEYCSKDGVIHSNFQLPKKIQILQQYESTVWKKWQQEILDILETQPDGRTIHWVYDPTGNNGKSYLCRYIYNKYKCIIASGKMTDIFNQCKNFLDENNNEDPEIILVDTPRSNIEYISYTALEKLKDKLLYSGKYEGGIVQFLNDVHVIVFANEKPALGKMSYDRFNIININ